MLFAIVVATGSLINGLFGLLIIVNSVVGMVQELRAKQTLDKLSIVGQAKPLVRRADGTRELPPNEVVSDDIIELGPGDQIVVDGTVIEGAGLEVDESLLTGEADPVLKPIDDMVMSGSFVVTGTGAYRATKVGHEAYAAKLTAEASKFSLVHSELQAGINKILQFITYLLIPAGLLIIYTQLFTTHVGWQQSVLRTVGALVPMVPEGLVLMTSIAFAVGVVRLGRRQCLIQELPAIEGLARVNVVCADKTGTLTENRMQVADLRQFDSAVGIDTIIDVLASMASDDARPNASIQAIGEAYRNPPGWTVTAPTFTRLMWVCATSTAGTRSVTGTNAAPLDAAAFVDLKTPPVVPIYTVLPLVSDGSTATLSTRPPAGPVAALLRLWGARGDHGTFSAAVPAVLCAITVAAAIPSSNSRPAARSTALRSPAPQSIVSPRLILARCGPRFCLVPYCCMIPEESALSLPAHHATLESPPSIIRCKRKELWL